MGRLLRRLIVSRRMGGIIMPNINRKNKTNPIYTMLTASVWGTPLFLRASTSGRSALIRINAINTV
jgi:hypothetical protein